MFRLIEQLLYPAQSCQPELERIFLVLQKMTKQKDVIEDNVYTFQKLCRQQRPIEDFVRLYIAWEHYLTHASHVEKQDPITSDLVRKEISSVVNVIRLDPKMRLLFVPERERLLYLCELFIGSLSEYLRENLGKPAFSAMIHSLTHGTDFHLIHITNDGFDFTEMHATVVADPTYTTDRITQIFKSFFEVFFSKIETSFGEKIAKSNFNKLYIQLQHTYDVETASLFLKVIPDRVLTIDEWFSLLSKQELERHIKEKTRELAELNETLEQKVKERTEDLQKAYEALKDLDHRKSDFISVVAHQLRTPLSGLKWVLDMMVKGEFGEINEDQKKFLIQSRETNEQMIHIVSDMLRAEKMISKKEDYNFTSVEMRDVINTIVARLAQDARMRSVTITLDQSIRAMPEIRADEHQITEALENIIENAIKYSKQGGGVSIKAIGVGATIRLIIKDSGLGIPQEQQPRIFERFFRAHNAIRVQANGSGLGLFISREIVRHHGGDITFESVEGKGTTFYVTLPVAV